MDEIKFELLKASYWEHFKFAKDLALIYPVNHPKRINIENELSIIQKQLEPHDAIDKK